MACIIVDGVIQGTFTIKELEQAIRDICSKDNGIDTLPTPIGYKTVVPEEHVSFICPSQVQEDIDKEIINSLHSYKPFSKCLSNG
jgi:hypothetical protein